MEGPGSSVRGIVAAAVLGLWLSGCATAPKTYDYPAMNLKIVAANPVYVNRACRSAGKLEFDDEGVNLAANRQINGCWSEGNRTMYVNWDTPEVVFHELCHVAGRPAKECAGVQWVWY